MRRRQAFNPLAHRCRCVAYFIITPEPPMGETTPSRAHVKRVRDLRAEALATLDAARLLVEEARVKLWDYHLRDAAVMHVENAQVLLAKARDAVVPVEHDDHEPEGLLFRIVKVDENVQTRAELARFGPGRRMEVVMRLKGGGVRYATDEERAAYGIAAMSELASW